MWMFVFFDLPVGTKTKRRHAILFRNFLKDDGFMMLQFSVYARVIRGEEAVDKHLARGSPRTFLSQGKRAHIDGDRASIRTHEASDRRADEKCKSRYRNSWAWL